MQQACRLSLDPQLPAISFEKSLAQKGPHCGDPLWPALARHLARSGDVLLNDGSVKNLDQFCEELNLPLLPLLEDMPDEIDLGPDWDKDLG